ncbi:MAG: D-glycero-beta-D-manno-heptose 1,7-bisphosphate 7-phosphatase [Geobacteraceae bacterium]
MERNNRAVFLDRDGTINEEKGYLFRTEEFTFIPGAPEAIRLLKEAGFLVIVVTNQSGVGRGYYDEAAVDAIHRHLDRELAALGTGVDDYYYCPHHPEHGIGPYKLECKCRKPLPGMLLQASVDHGIDLSSSYMIGDKLVDVTTCIKAGCQPLLIRTGYGAGESAELPPGVPVYDNILAAVRTIVSEGVRPDGLTP